jgi:hypothetical protein
MRRSNTPTANLAFEKDTLIEVIEQAIERRRQHLSEQYAVDWAEYEQRLTEFRRTIVDIRNALTEALRSKSGAAFVDACSEALNRRNGVTWPREPVKVESDYRIDAAARYLSVLRLSTTTKVRLPSDLAWVVSE